MHVGQVMHTELVTVPPDTSLVQAKDMIAEKKIAHLLVVDAQGQLVGIVSDRDVKQSWASPATTLSVHELNYILKQLTVDMIMQKNIVTIRYGARGLLSIHWTPHLWRGEGRERAPHTITGSLI